MGATGDLYTAGRIINVGRADGHLAIVYKPGYWLASLNFYAFVSGREFGHETT